MKRIGVRWLSSLIRGAAHSSKAPNPKAKLPEKHASNMTKDSSQRSNLQKGAPKQMLEDRFGRFHNYLRISLTERCNLRCTYCMPEEGVQLTPKEELLSAEEINRIVRVFIGEGVNRIRFTGGEPLLRKDLHDIVAATSELKPLGLREIAMTTNGITLGRKVPELKTAGLDSVNVSLDTLDPFKFQLLTRRNGMEKVMDSVQTCLDHGIKTKVNAVIIRGVNDEDVEGFAALAEERPLEVRFIEYMPFDGNRWDSSKLVPYQELVEKIRGKYPEFSRVRHEDAPNAVSKLWQVDGWKGRVGFITSMTEHFCGACNRVRITADGNLKACLFGNEEVSLRDAIREGAADSDLKMIIHETLQVLVVATSKSITRRLSHIIIIIGYPYYPQLQCRLFVVTANSPPHPLIPSLSLSLSIYLSLSLSPSVSTSLFYFFFVSCSLSAQESTARRDVRHR